MYSGKLLSFLAFNSTSFLSSNKGSKGKKNPQKNPSVGGKECVEGVWAHGGHSAASELPAPYLIFHNLLGVPLSATLLVPMHGSWPCW